MKLFRTFLSASFALLSTALLCMAPSAAAYDMTIHHFDNSQNYTERTHDVITINADIYLISAYATMSSDDALVYKTYKLSRDNWTFDTVLERSLSTEAKQVISRSQDHILVPAFTGFSRQR